MASMTTSSELCPEGCGDHLMMVVCLLALTLLVLWLTLGPPASRPLLPSARRAWTSSRIHPLIKHWPRSLTPVELSISRT